jgi:hypothetical protein
MQKIYFRFPKKITLLLGIIIFTIQIAKAQAVYLPLSYQFDQKFNSTIYSINTSVHTSLKPFLIDSALTPRYNALMNLGVDTNKKDWVSRKLINEHLFDVKEKDYTFYGDYLPDLTLGRDFTATNKAYQNTYLNTRGYQLSATIGDKFYFYTSGYENQGTFPLYYSTAIDKIDLVPGQAYSREFTTPDWSYATSILSYTPIKQLNITLGVDKTFIGDGYRSVLLSDYTTSYPLLRLTANLGKVQYMMMWAYLEDLEVAQFDDTGNNRRKWGMFHYLDWNVTNRLSLGFFNALIAEEADDVGNYHGFDANYVNPIFLSSSLGPSAQPDNALVGFTGKYKILDKTAIYGQLLFDRFKAGDFFSTSNTDNTGSVQLGIRGADLFKVKGFNYLFEYNAVKPYTYSSGQVITNYSEYSAPLGDPLGANFREFVGILNYSVGRLDFSGQINYAEYGLDPTSDTDYGGDLTKAIPPTAGTTTIGQGLSTKLYYAEGKVAFIINPKYNLRFELGALYRDQVNTQGNLKTTWLTFGLRSSFRDLYTDF